MNTQTVPTGRTRAKFKVAVLAVVTVAAVGALAGCGTRLSDAQIEAAGQITVASNGGGSSASAGGAGGSAVQGSGGGSSQQYGAGSVGANAANGLASGVGTGGQTGGALSSGTGASAAGNSGTGSTTGTRGATGATAAAGSGGTAGAGAAGTPCTGRGAPIIVGQTGAFSGLLGESTGNIRTGMSVWAKYINSIGGIQCHPVQLYQEDDGSDPSKSSANVTDLVNNKHSIAIVGADIPIVTAAATSTATTLGVPIVGGDLVPLDWFQNSNMFPSGASPLTAYAGAIGAAVKDGRGTKIGLLYCVEASICNVIHQNFNSMVAPFHAAVAFQQSVSLTQSSFTAECQNAKNAGVQILFLAVEGASGQRAASSCQSVNYHPTFAIPGIGASPNALDDPLLKSDGLYIGTNQVPFVMNDTPGLQIFHNAFQQFYGGNAPDQSTMLGWASGQLFAAALNAIGLALRSGPVTTAEVYQGLYLLKNETLGGLTPPLNFIKGKAAPQIPCFAAIRDSTSGLAAPNGSKFTCQ